MGLTTHTLSKEEISYLLTIPNVNQRKTIIQKKFIDNNIRDKFTLTIACGGYGKTHSAISHIQRIRKVSDELVIVVVPTSALKSNWEQKLKDIANIEVYVVNSYTMSDKTYKCHTLFVDEIHRMTNEDSQYFSKVFDITSREYTSGLSATMDEKNIKFLESKGLTSINLLTEQDSDKLQITPKTYTYNVPIDFTKPEKLQYYNVQKEIESLVDYYKVLEHGNKMNFMLPATLSNRKILDDLIKGLLEKDFLKNGAQPGTELYMQCYNKLKGVTLGKASKYMKLIKERANLLHSAQNKFKILDKILEEENQSSFIFFQSIATMELLQRQDTILYHSKLTTKQKRSTMLDFLTSDKHLCSVKKVSEGFDLETECLNYDVLYKDVEVVIEMGYNSTKTDAKQRSYRGKRFNANKEDKICRVYRLYVEDFEFAGEMVGSQEKVWLIRSGSDTKNVQIKEY